MLAQCSWQLEFWLNYFSPQIMRCQCRWVHLSLKNSPRPQNAMFVANCLLFFSHSKFSFPFWGGGWIALSKPRKVMLSKGVSKTRHLLFVVSFVSVVSSAQTCHGTAHNTYYIFICACGIWYVASSPMRFVIYHVCATWLPKAHLQTQSCTHLCRTQTIQSGVQAGSYPTEISILLQTPLLVARSLVWKEHFSD